MVPVAANETMGHGTRPDSTAASSRALAVVEACRAPPTAHPDLPQGYEQRDLDGQPENRSSPDELARCLSERLHRHVRPKQQQATNEPEGDETQTAHRQVPSRARDLLTSHPIWLASASPLACLVRRPMYSRTSCGC